MVAAIEEIKVLFTIFACIYVLFLPPPANAEFKFRINEDRGTLDWGYGEVNAVIVQQLMEGLTTSGPHGEAVPALAEKWVRSKQGDSYTFTLRRGARWSDGQPVCAQHFVDAWNRVLSPALSSPYAHLLADLKEARAQSCKKLIVSLKRPSSYFPALTSHWVLLPVRFDLISKFGRDWMKPGNLAVTGPYKLERWDFEKQFVLEKNSLYYGASPHEGRLRALVIPDDATALTMFRGGGLDWMQDVPFLEKEKLSQLPEYQSYPSTIEYHLGFSFGVNLPRNARCALALSLDKSKIPLFLKGGETPAWGLLPAGLLPGMAYSPGFNLKKARSLWPPEKGFSEINVFYYSKDVHEPLMQWIQEEWRRNLGARIKLVKLDGKSYWSRLYSDPPVVFLSGITPPYPHPFAILSEFLSESRANWGRFRSAAYDANALAVARREKSDSAMRRSIALAEKELLHDECAVIPLYFKRASSLLSRKWRGFSPNLMNYIYLKNITLRDLTQ